MSSAAPRNSPFGKSFRKSGRRYPADQKEHIWQVWRQNNHYQTVHFSPSWKCMRNILAATPRQGVPDLANGFRMVGRLPRSQTHHRHAITCGVKRGANDPAITFSTSIATHVLEGIMDLHTSQSSTPYPLDFKAINHRFIDITQHGRPVH